MTELDENGNPINPEGADEGDDEGGEDTTDYKDLYQKEKEAREQTEAEKQKRKERFKGAKAAENKTPQVDQDSIKKMVDESVWVVKFYSENKDANQYQQDIEALVAKGIERDKAFKYVIAEKDPSLLLDDAKKAQLNGNTALNGVPAQLNWVKNKESMTEEEINALSQEEFDKLFPSSWNSKKFFAE